MSLLRTDYQTDREWSDLYLPRIKALVGPHLLVPAPFEVDSEQATDLIVLRARDMMVACRVRRPGYVDKPRWRRQFTVRRKRASGAKTELEKFIDGFGDWMFYGHATGVADEISPWFLLDLDVFRAALIRMSQRYSEQPVTSENCVNTDGTQFKAYDIDSFPPQLVIASSGGAP